MSRSHTLAADGQRRPSLPNQQGQLLIDSALGAETVARGPEEPAPEAPDIYSCLLSSRLIEIVTSSPRIVPP